MTSTEILMRLLKRSALPGNVGNVNILGKVLKSASFNLTKFKGLFEYWVREHEKLVFPIDFSKIKIAS